MLLFFDTETTGKVDFKAPAHAPHQPRLVQLAALLTRTDGEELASFSVVVRPGDFEIPTEAAAIHGITTDLARLIGVDVCVALRLLTDLAGAAHAMLAWNIAFDRAVIEKECHEAEMFSPMEGLAHIDPMIVATDHCRLPGRYGSYKWPKLEEAYRHFFGREMSNAHDAMGDVRAMAEIWRRMRELGIA